MKAIFIVLLFLWIMLSFFDVIYNSTKFFSEYHEWGHLTDSQKRHKIFGDYYDFLILINNHTTTNDYILIYSTDVKTHYLGNYYLYPRDFVDTNNINTFLKDAKTKKFDYIAEYNNILPVSGYKEIAKMQFQKGIIYKKNE